MLDYLTILRMHYSQNLSFREIGASVGCGKTAVGRFITRFEELSMPKMFGSGEKSHVAPVGKSQILTNEKNQNYPSYTSFLE